SGERRRDFTGALHGEGEGERADAEGDGAAGMRAQALERERAAPQQVVHRPLGRMRKERHHAFHPRCSATMPAARLKYSTRSSPAACIIDLSVSWSGCMRIDSAR